MTSKEIAPWAPKGQVNFRQLLQNKIPTLILLLSMLETLPANDLTNLKMSNAHSLSKKQFSPLRKKSMLEITEKLNKYNPKIHTSIDKILRKKKNRVV